MLVRGLGDPGTPQQIGNEEKDEDAEPDQIAFELGVILAGTDIVSVLHDDLGVLDRARSAIRDRLGMPTLPLHQVRRPRRR